MHKRLKKVFCVVKEHSSVSYAKIATVGGFCDVDHIIVKATAPNDLLLSKKHIHDLLKTFSFSPTAFRSFSINFSRRFTNTNCWKVALKCLLLLHRLLRTLPENSPFRAELLWARSNNFFSLYPCHFRDEYSSNPSDYTIFIRFYAHLLDAILNCVAIDAGDGHRLEDDCEKLECLHNKMKEVSLRLEFLPQLQTIIDLVISCKPSTIASRNLIVQSAMKHIIRDSFWCYTMFRKEIILVLDSLIQMPYRSCVLAFGIYKKAAFQANELSDHYEWCKAKGFCGCYEYPFVDRIPEIQIRALETFLNGMWQITNSSSPATSPSSWIESNSSWTEEEQEVSKRSSSNLVVRYGWESFEEEEDEKEEVPLVKLGDHDDDEEDWEELLEASININSSVIPRTILINYPNNHCFSNDYEDHEKNNCGEEDQDQDQDQDQWQMQVYNSNPFSQPHYLPISYTTNPWSF